MDSNRRTILTTGAAVAATAAVPQIDVFQPRTPHRAMAVGARRRRSRALAALVTVVHPEPQILHFGLKDRGALPDHRHAARNRRDRDGLEHLARRRAGQQRPPDVHARAMQVALGE
jgi:hypothetical protein